MDICNVAGIYIHIPFCKKACTYCNFHFSTNLKSKNELLLALLHEIELQINYTQETIDTIYFGGGSPSLLDSTDIQGILNKIYNTFRVNTNIECTLEANPDDITNTKLEAWQKIGINRLSVGIQSFFDKDLVYMNRAHQAQQAIHCIPNIIDSGFDNYSIDLIFGFPLLTADKWKKNLDIALQYNIPHLSCYAMTIEPNTLLHHQMEKKITAPINQEQSARDFEYVMHTLQQNGYEHYEISSYAQPGKRAVHNSNYWNGKVYLGIGPSAHSYNGDTRQWNIANNALYINQINANIIPCETEILNSIQKQNEYIMIKLRTSEGIHKLKLNTNAIQTAQQFIHDGLMQEENNYYRLTSKGKFFADAIAMDFFL